MDQLARILRVLGDENRLRILRLLTEESLNVGELTQVLGLAQPTVSKHLAELRQTGLVEAVRSGAYSYYQINSGAGDWWQAVSAVLSQSSDEWGDLTRLKEVIKLREELSEPADRFVVPGRSWVAWSRGLRFLLPRCRVADFGCGDGAFTAEIAAWARIVYAVDANQSFLKLARSRCKPCRNVRFMNENMEQVSLAAGAVDLVVISQSLHYVTDPARVLKEAFRILVPGGRLLILDLLPHDQEWVSKLHHLWQGFQPEQLKAWIRRAGFRSIELDTGTKQVPEPFRIVIASGLKPHQKKETNH